MVHKFVFRLANASDGRDHDRRMTDEREYSELVAKNAWLHSTLNKCKNQITQYYSNRKWEQCKKYTNEYELVFTTCPEFPGIASYTPISRSFFKLWEMLFDYATELGSDRRTPMRAMFLAEGPGGFMESFAKFRSDHVPDVVDELHGITLLSRYRNVPTWKTQALARIPRHTIRIHRGEDGTGDLYRVANIDHLVDSVGASSCHFVTADGGFDFSGDFNNQEQSSTRLITAEVYAALRLQASGGCFVLKIFDVHANATMRLLAALCGCYRDVRIVKPLTSRPANSEKYVMCTDYSGADSKSARAVLSALRTACEEGGAPSAVDARLIEVDVLITRDLLRDVVEYNCHYITRQICYISRTILLIMQDQARTCKQQRADRVRLQLQKSLRWCHKYKIPLNPASLRKYSALECIAR